MRDFRPTERETVWMEGREIGPEYAAHVGLDVHKESIAVAVAPAGREPPVYVGEIANRPSALGKLARAHISPHRSPTRRVGLNGSAASVFPRFGQ